MTPDPLRAACPVPLPRMSPAQAYALRLADRDGLRWDGAYWLWGDAGVGVQVIRQATVHALMRRDVAGTWRGDCWMVLPSDAGRAWLAANPEPSA